MILEVLHTAANYTTKQDTTESITWPRNLKHEHLQSILQTGT